MFEHTEEEEEFFKIGLYPLAEALRMQASGACDPWPPEREKAVVKYLCKRILHWEKSYLIHERSELPTFIRLRNVGDHFGDAVNRVVREALVEWLILKKGTP